MILKIWEPEDATELIHLRLLPSTMSPGDVLLCAVDQTGARRFGDALDVIVRIQCDGRIKRYDNDDGFRLDPQPDTKAVELLRKLAGHQGFWNIAKGLREEITQYLGALLSSPPAASGVAGSGL